MKEGYKETELGWIPNDWDLKKLGEIGCFFRGKGVPKTEITDKGFNCLTYGDLYSKFDIVIKNIKSFIPIEVTKISQEIKYGDICFAASGETLKDIGKAAVYLENVPCYAGGDIIIFRGSENSLALSYFLNSTNVNRQKYKSGQGHSIVHIYSSQLKHLLIPVPPLSEQKAIADCLSTWDKAIELQNKLIDDKQNQKDALIQLLLTGKKRLPGFSDKWKEVKLGALFTERNEVKTDNLPLLSIGQDGVYPQTDSNKRDISNSDKSKYKRIAVGDIGYNTMRMWQGRSALSSLEGIVSPAYTILAPRNNVNSYYFSILFTTSKLTNLFWRNSQGLVDDTLNCKYKDFSKIKHFVPSFEEQNAIAEILKISEKEIQLEKQKLADLQEQKKGLMQQLLTGKVRLG